MLLRCACWENSQLLWDLLAYGLGCYLQFPFNLTRAGQHEVEVVCSDTNPSARQVSTLMLLFRFLYASVEEVWG